jgi:hypothetical protein
MSDNKNTRPFKKGDKVYAVGYGIGYVEQKDCKIYPVLVSFKDHSCSFTKDGYLSNYLPEQMLFHYDERPLIHKRVVKEIINTNGTNTRLFKKGDKVCAVGFGEGKVTSYASYNCYNCYAEYPVEVSFEYAGDRFTEDGYLSINPPLSEPTLFHCDERPLSKKRVVKN